MSHRRQIQRIRSFHAGKPLPLGETMQVPLGEKADVLLIASIRMGGESSPWAIGWKKPGGTCNVLAGPEPRNRDLVAEVLATFAPTLLGHLHHPDHCKERFEERDPSMPLRQIWMPNASHLEMLHFLNYRYTFAKKGPEDRVSILNALGRAAGWVFRESQRPGQVLAMVATEALRQAYIFPSEDTRQGHLGYLMAWLETPGTRDERMIAARLAERHAVSTSLDPALERDALQPLVERYHHGEQASASELISGLLKKELVRRLELTERAYNYLVNDPRKMNPGIAELADSTHEEHRNQYLRCEYGEQKWIASPETDRNPAAAAARYQVHQLGEDRRKQALVHHDRELQLEATESGDAISGRIVRVWDANEGQRGSRPMWEIEDGGITPLRLRRGSRVCVAGMPNRTGRLLEINLQPNGSRRFTIEITGWKNGPRKPVAYTVLRSTDPDLEGQPVTMVTVYALDFAATKTWRVFRANGPGCWLTHATQ